MKIYNVYAVRLNCNPANETESTGLRVKAFNKKEALSSAKRMMHDAGYFYSYSTKGVFVVEDPNQVSGFTFKEIETWSQEDLQENAFHLLLSDSRGIYIPRDFINQFRGWKGYGKGKYPEYKSILSDPENEDYWDAWDTLLNKLTKIIEGCKYSLFQDGDLFAVNLDLIGKWEELTGKDFDWNQMY